MPKAQKIQAEKLIGAKCPITKTTITEKDAIIYALGIGFSRDPLQVSDFKYTYEVDQGFCVFPTMGVTAPQPDYFSPLLTSQYMPEFSPFAILHAEQKLTMVKDRIEIGVEYEHEVTIADCLDKGKNAFVLYTNESYRRNEKGERELVFINETMLFIKGLGGFGFPGKGLIKPAVEVPKKNPDFKLVGETFPGQAFLYRLAHDINPLHVDPNIAKAQKFDKPILHGLASFGTVARVFSQNVLNNDSSRIKTVQTRFVGHVYPGETLDISVWRQGESMYIYQAEVRERKTKAILGYIETRPAAKL